jgi:hypothetical protein
MMNKTLVLLASFAIGFSALVCVTGCSVDSADSVVRSVNANVAGFYSKDSSVCGQDRFVTANSGKQVISLDLRQTGDQLEAIDNNGIIFRGTIGNVVDNSASFNIEGSTTAGNKVLISGNIAIGGGEGVMRATWIEDTFYATLCGSANGPSVTSNTPTPSNSVSNVFYRANERLMQNELASYRKTALWFYEG